MIPKNALAQSVSNTFSVDLRKYIGLWYEAARTTNEFQDNIVTKNGEQFAACYNSTATYNLEAPDQIGVRNTCVRRSKKGTILNDGVRGRAAVQPGTRGQKLKIAFGSGVARFFQKAISGGGFDYWIYCIGPVNAKGLYDWAVVSGEKKDYLFILTRDKKISNAKRNKILSCARSNNLPVNQLLFRQR